MLGPELNSYLMESDRVLLSWIQASTLDDFGMRLRNLVFRMLNRYLNRCLRYIDPRVLRHYLWWEKSKSL